VGLTDILNTARDAMSAQTFGLTVTGQNVSNVNTPGYVRRQAVLETRDMGPGNFGGVNVQGIRRVADQFVEQRHLSLTGLSAEASSRDQLLGQAEALFNDFAGTGLSSSMSSLFSSFSALSSLPNDPTTRETVLQRAETFAGQVRGAAEQVANFRTELFSQARDVVGEINEKLDTIASLSGRINEAQAAGNEAADLKDKRDALLVDLTKQIEVRTYTDGNGQLVVQGPGVTLVQGDTARHLDLDVAADGSVKVLAKNNTAGGAGSNVTKFLSGGELAGILNVRDRDVVEMQTDLDEFAFHLAGQINSVHSAGFGLDGAGGRAFFDAGATVQGAAGSLRVSADIAGQPDRLAASSNAASLPGDGSQATALAAVADGPIAALGGLDPGEAYGRLIGNVGQRKQRAATDLETRDAMTAQIETMRQSVSGVSLDEEMVAMTQFQRAFEAASRVFTTADQLLEDLINTLGR
jgi:flagellar hook-associated protein 1 FlgK